MNYLQNKYISRHYFKNSLHYRVKHKRLKNVATALYQFLMTKLCRTFMITLWIVNRLEKHILRNWNITSLLYDRPLN